MFLTSLCFSYVQYQFAFKCIPSLSLQDAALSLRPYRMLRYQLLTAGRGTRPKAGSSILNANWYNFCLTARRPSQDTGFAPAKNTSSPVGSIMPSLLLLRQGISFWD